MNAHDRSTTLYTKGGTMRFKFMLMLALASGVDTVYAQTVVAVAPFTSVELRDGGSVVIRHGPAQRVTVVEPGARDAEIVVEGDRLRISRCRSCRHDRRLRVEVITPVLESVSVRDGGTIALEGQFPAQARLVATVFSGGAIDVRTLNAEQVTAAVEQGGGIFTRPSSQLDASVTQGGAITYWGDPTVRSNVEHGGVVARGRSEDANRPLQEMGRRLLPVAPVPPVPAPLHRL
jgi:hypothetical protein